MSYCVKLVASAALTILGVATALAQGAQQEVSITASVGSTCRFGGIFGTASPNALNTTIPVSAAGVVDTTTQTFLINNVLCTRPASVLATSINGGVKSATPAGPGFTNIINYKALARYGFAQSNVDTSTIPAAAGPESGNPATMFLPWWGTLRIEVTPLTPTQRLVAGTDYGDVLKITLTPVL